MITNNLPFNISIIDNRPARYSMLTAVEVVDIYDGLTTSFHPQGLYSSQIFGAVGDEQRLDRFSYINMHTKILSPIICQNLWRVSAFYKDIMRGKRYAIFDEKQKNFIPADLTTGKTGYGFFMSHWSKLSVAKSNSYQRNNNIEMFDDNQQYSEVTYLPVIPAGMRDIQISPSTGRATVDEVNNLYRSAISLSNTFIDNDTNINDPLNDTSRYSMQLKYNAIYNTFKDLLFGKRGYIQAKWASRKVFDATANVISSMDVSCVDLDSSRRSNPLYTNVGLYQTMKGQRSLTVYGMVSGWLSKVFDRASGLAHLIDPKTLKGVDVPLTSNMINKYCTAEGIEKLISTYGNNALRHTQMKVGKYYLALIFENVGTFKVFHGIDTIPEVMQEKIKNYVGEELNTIVRPVTWTEMFYTNLYNTYKESVATLTRYPIIGFGSIYPTFVNVLTTNISTQRLELDADWKRPEDVDRYTAEYFPTTIDAGSFMNTMQPHPCRLNGLDADFDGDKCSLIFISTMEGRQEMWDYLNSDKAIFDHRGKTQISCGNKTSEYTFLNLTLGASRL